MAALSSTIFNTSFLHHQPNKTMHSRLLSNQTGSLFGLKSSTRSGATMMASYKVTLITPDGTKEFECPDDVYIIDQAFDAAGLELPYSCKSGAWSSCAGKVKSGSVNQLDGNFLEEEQMNAGWVLTCVAYPISDVVIETHKEAELVA